MVGRDYVSAQPEGRHEFCIITVARAAAADHSFLSYFMTKKCVREDRMFYLFDADIIISDNLRCIHSILQGFILRTLIDMCFYYSTGNGTCDNPTSPENGNVELNACRRGAMFSCMTNYKLIGEAEVTCDDNGAWSANFPVCELDDGDTDNDTDKGTSDNDTGDKNTSGTGGSNG